MTEISRRVELRARRTRPRHWEDGFGGVATRALQVLILLALATVIVTAGIALKTEVIAVLLALILACAFSPVVRLLTTKVHLPRTLAALVTLIAAIAALAGILTLVGFAVARQAKDLVSAAEQSTLQVETFLKNLGVPIVGDPGQQLLKAGQKAVSSASVQSGAISGLGVVGELGAGTVLLIFVLFFFLRDGSRIWHFLMNPLRSNLQERGERIGSAAVLVLGSYTRGVALVALVDAVLIGIALTILQVPLALPLAVIVFIAAFIPIVGAVSAGALATAVALVSQGPVTALIVLAVVIAIFELESHLLHPLIMSRAVSLHPLAVLLALTAGTILGGIIGAILAVPTASVVWAAIKAWNGEPVSTNGSAGHGVKLPRRRKVEETRQKQLAAVDTLAGLDLEPDTGKAAPAES